MTSQFAVFILPLTAGSEEEETMNRFLRSCQVIQLSHRLVEREGGPVWSFLVEYRATPPREVPAKEATPIDYREILGPEEFARFRSLRDLRKLVAERQGVPVYAVFTNRQLADMAHTCPTTIQDLRAIEGVGSGKADRYGAEFLEAI